MRLPDWIQWPAMAVTVLAAWYVASTQSQRRRRGFWLYLLGNLLWIVWGLQARAYALITLQVCLAALNIRGERKASHIRSDARNPTPRASLKAD